MTTTTIINAQSFGTGANTGNNLFAPAATSLQTGTTAYVVSVRTTMGTGEPLTKTTKVRVWYTSSYATVTAQIPEVLGQTARYVDVTLDRPIAICDSTLEPSTGGKFYCWVDAPTQSVAGTITVTLVELP